MKVRASPELCYGRGLCASNCPQVFELVNDKAAVKMDEVPLELRDLCEMPVFSCPTNAIFIEE